MSLSKQHVQQLARDDLTWCERNGWNPDREFNQFSWSDKHVPTGEYSRWLYWMRKAKKADKVAGGRCVEG